MGFNTSSIWIKVALICLLLGTLLFVIGFATNVWMTTDGYRYANYGLWRVESCDRVSCSSFKITHDWLRLHGMDDWYHATQAFECMGLIAVCIALLICLLFVFVDTMRKRTPLLATIFFCFAAVLCMVIGFLIIGIKMEYYSIGWSMGLAIAGCALTFVAGVMCVIDLKK